MSFEERESYVDLTLILTILYKLTFKVHVASFTNV